MPGESSSESADCSQGVQVQLSGCSVWPLFSRCSLLSDEGKPVDWCFVVSVFDCHVQTHLSRENIVPYCELFNTESFWAWLPGVSPEVSKWLWGCCLTKNQGKNKHCINNFQSYFEITITGNILEFSISQSYCMFFYLSVDMILSAPILRNSCIFINWNSLFTVLGF